MKPALPTSAFDGVKDSVSALADRLSDQVTDRLTDGLAGRLQAALASLIGEWASAQRLYTLEGDAGIGELMLESFTAHDAVSQPFELRLQALSLDAQVDLQGLLGRRATLQTTLADGSRAARSGIVTQARSLGADGGLARWRLTLQPWIALLGHASHSRVWQDKSVIQVLDDVFAPYAAQAAWQWGEAGADGGAEDLMAFLARGPNGGVRNLCVQYRETDLAFAQRLLAQEGLGWRVEESAEAPAGHRVVFYADSARWPENLTSSTSAGIRFHRASSQETQDAIQSFGGVRELRPAGTTTLRWEYRHKRAVAAQVPTDHRFGGPGVQDMADWLASYDPAASEADTGSVADNGHAQHRATLAQQAHEARNKLWLGRSTVRSLRPGTRFLLTQSNLDALDGPGADREFAIVAVRSLGINNMPKELGDAIARSLGPAPAASDPFEPDADRGTHDALADDPLLQIQAAASGHANRFEAVRRAIPWRPQFHDRPTALGLQTAIVAGPDGSTAPRGADELHTDALGRIKVRFHWQGAPHADPRADNGNSCWVRVAQRWAGAGMGLQFIPRIGHEVLVQFLEGDAERPVVVGSLHNGQGEAGRPATPGGEGRQAQLDALAASTDHRSAAQGNLMGGQAPAWHGGAPGDARTGANAQNNAAALGGIKSKEFGADGFNQLVFDDTPGQLRVQWASTQHASQLNLGHLVHQADNHRGSFRGRGFELRTDAYGAVRATQGLLVTSYGVDVADPAGDNAPGMALLKQAATLADSFSGAARTHQTTALATALGTTQAAKSLLSEKAAPMKALHTAASGMVSARTIDEARGDAVGTATAAKAGKLPHTTDPVVAISAKAGFGLVAGQDLQYASGDALSWQAAQDLQVAGGQQLRVNTGQSLGVLAGAVQAGDGARGKGLTVIAGKGPVQVQAQAGQAQVAAKGLVNVQSAHAHIDWAAAKKITLATAGGASIVIDARGITTQCPGKITVKAASKSFVGPGQETYPLPKLPSSKHVCVECLLKALRAGAPVAMV